MKISGFLTRKPKKYKKLVTDPQAHKVYQMERTFIGHSIHTRANLNHMKAVARHATKLYRVPKLRLRTVAHPEGTKLALFGEYFHSVPEIVLYRDHHGDNMGTLIHELAHHIAMDYYGHVDDHGPEFVGVYGELLDRYRLLPIVAFEALRKQYGLEISYPDSLDGAPT